MSFQPGHPKWGGRKPGTPNKPNATINERARAIGVDPFEVLLKFAKGDWEGLGYEAKSTTKWTSSGIEYEEDVITPQMRLFAAKECVQYLEPKKKAIEVSNSLSPQEQLLVDLFRERMEAHERANLENRATDHSGDHATGDVLGPTTEVPGPTIPKTE